MLPLYLEAPVLPVRGHPLFPMAVVTLTIGRASTLRALDATDENNVVIVVAQRNPQLEEVAMGDLYGVGTAAAVLRASKIPSDDGSNLVLLQGIQRVRLVSERHREPYLRAGSIPIEDVACDEASSEYQALRRNVADLFVELVDAAPNLPGDVARLAGAIQDASVLADLIAASLPFASRDALQQLLDTTNIIERMRLLTAELVKEREDVKLRKKIRAQVEESVTDHQRRFLLHEQMKAISRELGEEDGRGEVEDFTKRIEECGMSEEAQTQAQRELSRLRQMPLEAGEYSVIRNYLEWLTSVPWKQSASDEIDVERAATVLDEDHYDLEKVKERILEYLAVLRIRKHVRGPILCFVGPPGVGKTSLGRSVARAMGRRFVRVSLGGMHDEAEIRGHRRTYVGALPGQIIQGIRRAGTNDPVFMLDEIDKIGRDFRGDPAAALLEVLDPEQNATFKDHFLDVQFDLSRVVFLATANVLDPIPPALRDRLEILDLAGYSDEEKLHIARGFLVRKQIAENGLGAEQIAFDDEGLLEIVHGYTHEAGVRELERSIASVCRKRARQIAGDGEGRLLVTPSVVRRFLGVPRYRIESELVERTRVVGVAVALAWTPCGGDLLFVETMRMPRDKGEFTITGQVKTVMKESAKAALSWLRANGADYGIDAQSFKDSDVHIHVPAGAVPKDGPSAGVVIVVSMLSLFTNRPVRPYVALTGEISLSGLLLPVGGIKEKVLAARRSGIREIVLPEANRAHVMQDVPSHVRDALGFRFARTIAEAIEWAFEDPFEMAQSGLRPRISLDTDSNQPLRKTT